ncbi:hypothetical protein PISMIDRAFT_674827 [Pisolithus microcarpus 441]|uniref:Uncharacterized protein n=1 Tax=Pisolithus microcarpus 441 TaxID=765257 RepID=A0A0C9ZDW0_9AGAM|nr:hypothetical protein PISMIDRAFT_674827 [Pisolithus microcarpus 441]
MSSPGPFADVAVSDDLDLLLSDPEDVAEPFGSCRKNGGMLPRLHRCVTRMMLRLVL